MKKHLFFLFTLCFFFSCSSDDKEETDEDLIQKYESYLIGTWVPIAWDYPEDTGEIQIYKNDRTATFYNIKEYKNGVYKVDIPSEYYNVKIQKYNNIFEINCYYISQPENKEFLHPIPFTYMDKDSLAFPIYDGKRLIYRKVSDIKIEF